MVPKVILLLLYTVTLLLNVNTIKGQSVNYTANDGLASNTVYDLCQSTSGYLWFATENGLSRFDGKNWRTFTTDDGLPDNEVLKLFADTKGRVWISTYNKQIAYIYNNTIKNKNNDALLSKLNFQNFVTSFGEDVNGNFYISDENSFYIIDRFLHIKLPRLVNKIKDNIDGVNWYSPSNFLLYKSDSLFIYNNELNQFLFKKVLTNNTITKGKNNLVASKWNENLETIVTITKPALYLSETKHKYANALQYYCSTNGLYTLDTLHNTWDKHLLPGKKISHAITDNENNIWCSSLGQGVYKLPNTAIATLAPNTTTALPNSEVYSISKYNQSLLAGNGFSKFFTLQHNVVTVFDKSAEAIQSTNPYLTNRLYCSLTLPTGAALLGFDSYLALLNTNQTFVCNTQLYPIKALATLSPTTAMVATSKYCFVVNTTTLQVLDTLWNERCTSVYNYYNTYYFATLNGVYSSTNKVVTNMGTLHHSFTRRVNAITADANGSIWFATADAGLLQYNNNKVITTYTTATGLNSNICKSLHYSNGYLWVGTTKGINKINTNTLKIVNYTTADGLPSNIINCIYTYNNKVYVGTSEGLSTFTEADINQQTTCTILLESVATPHIYYNTNTAIIIPYSNNAVSFTYSGISYKSGGNITYMYRIIGLHTTWQTTTQNMLQFTALPYGKYVFEIYAVNKFGVNSNTLSIPFAISKPFYYTVWFWLLVALVIIALMYYIVKNRNAKKIEKIRAEAAITLQLANVEQQALQAQMNPHFIFNCMGAIQSYIVKTDIENANKYLGQFAKLIRQTLDLSEATAITLANEVDYLTTYVALELLRFKNSFTCTMSVAPHINQSIVELPALLLQPFVENSIKHGLRNGVGNITIQFVMDIEYLTVTIADDGIGREASLAYNKQFGLNHNSKGIDIIKRRITLLNTSKTQLIILNMNDSELGTVIEVKIPI